jgi:uncharacterized protein YijF (DUF1287 family)
MMPKQLRERWIERFQARWPAVLSAVLIGFVTITNAAADPATAQRLVASARSQIGVTVGYDGGYRRLAYPNGDVPIETGVCTDVVIRAMRGVGIDLQREVHEDRKRHPDRYAKRDSRIDRSIDHRRVPNLQAWFASHAEVLRPSTDVKDFKPGDIVSWKLPGGLDHIGIVSDRRVAARPLILHNISRGTQEEDVLFEWTVTGHYRLR